MKRSFFQYVSLNVLGALGLSGYILADTLFVAHRLGTDGLAALNLAISVFGLINGLGLMLGIGGPPGTPSAAPRGDGVRADRAFSRALACGGTLGGLLALAGLLWAVPLARLLGAEGAILPMCSVYLRTVLFFAPCFLLNHILTAFVRNDGNPKLAMAAMLLGSLSNIVLDYVFLYPMDMGIFGAALATGIAPVVGLCVSSLHILTRRSHFRLRPFRPALRPLADLAGLGSAAFLNECSSGLVLAVFNLVPLPPLDGSKILAALLSDRARYKFYQYQNMLSMIGMLLIVSGALTGPLSVLENAVYGGVSWLAALPFRLVGVL